MGLTHRTLEHRVNTFTKKQTITVVPAGTSFGDAPLVINPATSVANGRLLDLGLAGADRFYVDEDGDATAAGVITAGTHLYAGMVNDHRVGWSGDLFMRPQGDSWQFYNASGLADSGFYFYGSDAGRSSVTIGDLAVVGKKYLRIKGDDDSDDDPGCLVLYTHAGTPYYLWVDNTGDLRIHTAAPTDEDADGTVVGAQS